MIINWRVVAPAPKNDVDLRFVLRVGVTRGEVHRVRSTLVIDEPSDVLKGLAARLATLVSDRALEEKEGHRAMVMLSPKPGSSLAEVPNGYCPNHATGVKLPDDFAVTPLQYVE